VSIIPPDESEEESDRQPWQGGTVTFFFRENCGFGRLSTITVRYKRFSCSEKEFLGVRADSKKRGGCFQNCANMAGRINRTVNGSPETTAKRCTKRLLRQHRTISIGHPNAVQRARQEVHISREQIEDLRFTVPGNGGRRKEQTAVPGIRKKLLFMSPNL
jgi:hypothetical protein